MADVTPDFTFTNATTADGAQVQDVIDEIVAGVNDRLERILPSHTFGIMGEVRVPSGQFDYITPFYVEPAAGQTLKLAKVRARINAGTSATCKLTINGVDASGFTGMVVTPAGIVVDPADLALAAGDLIALVVTAISGTPQNMSVSVFLEHASA